MVTELEDGLGGPVETIFEKIDDGGPYYRRFSVLVHKSKLDSNFEQHCYMI